MFAGLFLGALWFVLCRQLSGEWSINEQYNYGWFVPFFAGYLFWLRWEDRPPEDERLSAEGGMKRAIVPSALAVIALLSLLPLRLFEVANPDWRPLNWLHAAAVVTVTLIAVWFAGGKPWLKHFAFPVAFIFVAVPWISAIEQPVVQGLMRVVAVVATEIANLCGLPAEVEGNLIRLNTGLVGVNEACSGVRSIQTSLMIGLLFGELKRLTVPRRFALVLIALAVAIVGNFARAFFLVWVAATREKQAFTSWHDIAGYSIVGAVFVACIAAASLLARDAHGSQRSESSGQRAEVGDQNRSDPRSHSDRWPLTSLFRLPTLSFLLSLAWLLAVELGTEFWYRSHERRETAQQSWVIAWPESAPGFREMPIDESVRATLRFDEGREASWNMAPTRCLLYFFRWNPGGSSVVRARAHRPDICLPSAGWRQISDSGVQDFDGSAGLKLPFRRVSFAHQSGATTAHTYFCLHEDKRTTEARRDLDLPAGAQPDWSFPARWQAVRNGVRNMGQQVMEFIILAPSNISAEEADSRFAGLLPTLVRPQR